MMQKKEHSMQSKLKINEVFYSIQGEGPLIGRPAVFIRFSGCNLSCPFCDTKHETGEDYTIQEVYTLVGLATKGTQGAKAPLLILTGGEPFNQPVGALLASLLSRGFTVQVETNGTLLPEDVTNETLDKLVIVCSPKKNAPVDLGLGKHITAYKFLIDTATEAMEFLPYTLSGRPVYLQPLDNEKALTNRKRALNFCKKYNLGFSPQLHKLIGVE